MKINIPKIIQNQKYCETLFKHYIKLKILKKTNPSLFKKHVNKAINNLEFANFILGEHAYSIKEKLADKTFYDWCIIVYYYAIYHTALALAAKIGYDSKGHLATITAITLFYYHKDNILKKEDMNFLIEKINLEKEDITLVIDAKDLREKACYGTDKLFELSQAKRIQRQTAEFINKIRPLLEE